MQPFILKQYGDNILIVNVKKILHTDPSFWLAGFGVLPNDDIFPPAASIKCTVDVSGAADLHSHLASSVAHRMDFRAGYRGS